LTAVVAGAPQALRGGLPENIMAGVRRSAIIKKNRRMRTIGLRTALTAAACLVLVLFAASGFGPGRRAESVSIRSREEAQQALPAPTTAIIPVSTPENPARADNTAPVGNSVYTPVPAWTPAPVQDPASSAPDAYLAAGDNMETAYTTPQPNPYVYHEPAAPAGYPAAPAAEQYDTPIPFETEAPVAVQNPFPAVASTPAPPVAANAVENAAANGAVRKAAPAIEEETAQPAESDTSEQEAGEETTVFSFFQSIISNFDSAAPDTLAESKTAAVDEAQTEAGQNTETADMAVSVPNAAPAESQADMQKNEAAKDDGAVPEQEATEAPALFSFFSSISDRFDAAPEEDALPEANAPSEEEKAPAEEKNPAPFDIVPNAFPESFSLSEVVPESEETTGAEDGTEKTVKEESARIYGREPRNKLLAMLGSNTDVLPQEAELTRVVHLTLVPEDEYGTEEKLDINIYGDFVYCQFYLAGGGTACCRADCSLRELDSFLAPYLNPVSTPTPSPTADPFAAELPQA
jgi:hypothetical protein